MNNLILVGREDLVSFTKDIVKETISEWAKTLKVMPTNDENELVSYKQAKSQLKKADSTLWEWHKRDYLTKQFIGGSVYYRNTDLQRILRGCVIRKEERNVGD